MGFFCLIYIQPNQQYQNSEFSDSMILQKLTYHQFNGVMHLIKFSYSLKPQVNLFTWSLPFPLHYYISVVTGG